jgi:glycerophosphoryl diester phosphodiesterase
VNDKPRMSELLKAGVSGIISDRPDLLLEAVREFDANKDGTPGDYLLADGRIDASKFDAQGHRGARNLRPENTLPAFEAALDNLMTTLETDSGITRDGVSVLKHDPYIEAQKCRRADGQPYAFADEVLIKNLTLAQLQSGYVCDKLFRGPEQRNDVALSPVSAQLATAKGYISPYVLPKTQDLFDLVSAYITYYSTGAGASHPAAAQRVANARQVRFNIETKLNPRSDSDAHGNVYRERTVSAQQMADTLAGLIVANNLQDAPISRASTSAACCASRRSSRPSAPSTCSATSRSTRIRPIATTAPICRTKPARTRPGWLVCIGPTAARPPACPCAPSVRAASKAWRCPATAASSTRCWNSRWPATMPRPC